MKIAFFSIAHISFGGGFERQIQNIAELLIKNGHEVAIITTSRNFTFQLSRVLNILYFNSNINSSRKTIFETPLRVNKKISIREFYSFFQLRDLLREYDAIYSKNEILETCVLRLVKKKYSAPFIGGMHTLLYYERADKLTSKLHNFLYSSRIYFSLLGTYSAIHCINQEQKKILSKSIKHIKFFTIPNFISISQCKPDIRKRFEVLYVGRLTQEKGIDTFLHVIERINTLDHPIKIFFTIVGSGPFENDVLQVAKKYKNVIYKGHVPSDKMKDIYKAATVLCVTSRGESFSLVSVEAQSYGLPVVGFNISGLRDTIVNGENGYLVSQEDYKSLVKTILNLYKKWNINKKDYNRLTENSIKNVQRHYSQNVLEKEYLDMFKKVKRISRL